MSTQPPLHEVKAMLKAFMDSKTTTAIDLKKVSQLVDVAIEQMKRREYAISMCHEALATYGEHPIIDAYVNKALNK